VTSHFLLEYYVLVYKFKAESNSVSFKSKI